MRKEQIIGFVVSRITRLFIVFITTLSLLSGCQGTDNLHFETIAQGNDLGLPDHPGYLSPNPNLMIIYNSDQIKNFSQDVHFGNDLVPKLEAVDYKVSFVIIVVRGKSDVPTPDISKVTRDGDLVTVYTHFGIYHIMDYTIMSPYKAIKVFKSGNWKGAFRFTMRIDQETSDQTIYMP